VPRARSRLPLLLCAALALSACSLFAKPSSRIRSDSRVAISVTLSAGFVHLEVLVAPRCSAAGEGCPGAVPMSELAVAVRTPRGDRALGTTWRDGGLDVAFSQLESLFPSRTLERQRAAPLLVEGRVVADLPIGEIFHRQSIVESAIVECDEALADAQLDHDYAQELLGRMLDLRLLGIADERLTARTTKLSERIREKPAAMWSSPHQRFGRAEALIAGMRARGEQQAVPEDVQREIARGVGTSSSFRWALEWLPTVCKVGVTGSAIAGQIALTGAPGVALAIIEATVGDVFSDWIVDSCCKRLGEVLGASKPPECS
jgi:hypothetical protein